jgi:hypothetical protein
VDINYIECACYSPEHTMKFTKIKEENIVYVTVHLSSHSFFQRLVVAIRYIFGYSSRYGHFDEFLLDGTQKQKLIEILND